MILSGFPLKCNLQNMHSIPGWRNRNVYLDWAKHSWQYRGYSFRRPDGKACPQPGDSPDGEANRTLLDLLIFFGIAVIAIAHPTDGKQVTMLVILFIMLGQMAMGLVFSFSSTWWTLPITALALAGYYFLPEFFYLWMALLGGGGMIALGLHIRYRW